MAAELPRQALLALVRQQPPFRFVDAIRELDDEHVVASYRFRRNKLRVEAALRRADGTLVCSGTFAGLGVLGA